MGLSFEIWTFPYLPSSNIKSEKVTLYIGSKSLGSREDLHDGYKFETYLFVQCLHVDQSFD